MIATTSANQTVLARVPLPANVRDVFERCPKVHLAGAVEELVALATRDVDASGFHEVAYDVPGRGRVVEARVCQVKNGVAANYLEPYMRRRDPECMVIADAGVTRKTRYVDRFGAPFDPLRQETLDWLAQQELACFFFDAGVAETGLPALAIVPANAGFFGLGLAMLQGIRPLDSIDEHFEPKAVIFVAPPFRHTHFEGKQVVVHNRLEGMHELFAYNLYPGPSAKKGIYGVLLTQGEREDWITAHCSAVEVVTPYDNVCTIMHEGASGGGKSEMLEHAHREDDGRLLLGRNVVTGEERHLILPHACTLRPVTDDMGLCHPSDQVAGSKKLTLRDAEESWFLRVNHITSYGSDPKLEKLTAQPPGPLLFLNIDTVPGGRALIWEHVQDAPGKPCPNPRVVMPRRYVENVVDRPVQVDVRSFGVRTPPMTSDKPTYGIVGLVHVLPPALAWLWRLVAPRGHANPSITDSAGMTSEGVGSYWPFATGRQVDQANLILRQIVATPSTMYVLTPNQHVGAWKTSFMPQWIMREHLARRGQGKFPADALTPSRCPLLGWSLRAMQLEEQVIEPGFLQVDLQPEVGPEAYDTGARLLEAFFHDQLALYLTEDSLDELGRRIIQACLNGANVDDYTQLID